MRCNSNLSRDEINRYNRQIRLSEVGLEGQKKIKGSSVLVIGAGALGCPNTIKEIIFDETYIFNFRYEL